MINLTALLGIAPPSKKEKKEEPQNISYNVLTEIRKKLNLQEPFTLVYIELARQNGGTIGDVKYISDLVGGSVLTKKNIGVLVPLGGHQAVYDKLEELANAPFTSDLRVGYGSFPGSSDGDIHVLGNILADAQHYRSHRKYAGKQPETAVSSEKVLECA